MADFGMSLKKCADFAKQTKEKGVTKREYNRFKSQEMEENAPTLGTYTVQYGQNVGYQMEENGKK